jgi:hypothetical protein
MSRDSFTLRFERVKLNSLRAGEKFTHASTNATQYWSPYCFEQHEIHHGDPACDFDVYRVTEIDEIGDPT